MVIKNLNDAYHNDDDYGFLFAFGVVVVSILLATFVYYGLTLWELLSADKSWFVSISTGVLIAIASLCRWSFHNNQRKLKGKEDSLSKWVESQKNCR